MTFNINLSQDGIHITSYQTQIDESVSVKTNNNYNFQSILIPFEYNPKTTTTTTTTSTSNINNNKYTKNSDSIKFLKLNEKDFEKYPFYNSNSKTTTNTKTNITITVDSILGSIKIKNIIYLIFIKLTENLKISKDLNFLKIKKIFLLPLNFNLCKKKFFYSNDSILNENKIENSPILYENENENEIIQDNQNLLFSNSPISSELLITELGVLSNSFKSSPVLSLNNSNLIYKNNDIVQSPNNDNSNEIIKDQGVKYVSDSDIINHDSNEYTNETISPLINSYSSSFSSSPNLSPNLNPTSNSNHHHHSGISKFKIIRQIKFFFENGGFYFSNYTDLSKPFNNKPYLNQNNHNNNNNNNFTDLEYYQSIFTNKSELFWNRFLLKNVLKGLIELLKLNPELSILFNNKLVYPLIEGFVGFFDFQSVLNKSLLNNIDNTEINLKLLLISKRSTKRCGLRYMRRGVDSNGDVANFVETEQILLYNNLHPNPDNNENKLNYSKFKIIRGSIPLFFTQDSSKLQPTPIVKKDYKTNKSYLIKHFNNLEKFYNKELELSIDKNITNNEYKQFTVVNLINKSKKEQKLGEMFSSILNELSINNCWFDFHAICKGLNFDNINLLLDETINNDDNNKTTTTVNENLLNYSYSSNYLDLKQKGIFRINCIDCLDRTNIISKFLSSKILERQLKDLNILNIRQQHQQDNNKSNNDIISIMNTKKFNFKYSNLWADNGDSISNQYASTNALKGDFTRTSKRKYSGILNDGYLTLIRYFNNYIRDYYNQILIDFLIGNAKFEIFEIFESNFNNFDPNLKIEADLNKKIIFNLILKSCINNNNTHSTTDNFRKKLNNNLNIDKKEVIIDAFWCKSCFEINTLINYKKPLKDIILILTNENLRLISYDLNEKTEDIEKIVRDDTDIEGEMEPDTEIEDNNNSNNNNNNNGSGEIYDTGSETIKRIEIYKIKNTDLIKFNHGCYYFNIDSNLSKNKDKNIGLKFQFNKCTLEIMNLKDGSETDDILISPSLKQIQDERYKNEENVHLLSDDFQQHSDQKLPILNISDDDDKEESKEENGDGLEDVNDLKFLAVKFPQDASPSAKQRTISLISKFCYTAETAENDIVSLEKARRHTPLINTLSYQVKKFIWS